MLMKYFKSAVPNITLRIYEIVSYKINASRIFVLNRNIIIIIISKCKLTELFPITSQTL
jgi:hypothetical protein